MVDSLTVTEARNQILPVGGPEILLREDIPKIFSRIFNKEPIIINVPLFAVDGLRGVWGLFDSSAQTGLGTFRTLLANEFYCTSEENANLERIYNFQLETVENFLRRYLAI